MVSVRPPLFCREPSWGSPVANPGLGQPLVGEAPKLMLWPPSVTVPANEQLSPLEAMMLFVSVAVALLATRTAPPLPAGEPAPVALPENVLLVRLAEEV